MVNRWTYSGQKKRHLIKFMSLVLPDGYVLDTIGPYYGTMNDASITENILETNTSLLKWCGGSGQMILDRGFRDVKEAFEMLGYETRIPEFLQKGEKQYSTAAGNTTRLCTKTRWTIESYHGRMKKWRFLDSQIHNAMIPQMKVGFLQLDPFLIAPTAISPITNSMRS